MKPAPPVTRYTFEPLVFVISDKFEDCIVERIIRYFKIRRGRLCQWDLKFMRERRAYLALGYGWFERIDDTFVIKGLCQSLVRAPIKKCRMGMIKKGDMHKNIYNAHTTNHSNLTH
jgi:hypothetical protein